MDDDDNELVVVATPRNTTKSAKKRKRASFGKSANPYDTLRRCHRQITTPNDATPTPNNDNESTIRQLKSSRREIKFVDPSTAVSSSLLFKCPKTSKKTTSSSSASKEKMLLMRIYKKLRASESAAVAAGTGNTRQVDELDGEYENLDDLMTAVAAISQSASNSRRPVKQQQASSSSEHIYCNSDFFC